MQFFLGEGPRLCASVGSYERTCHSDSGGGGQVCRRKAFHFIFFVADGVQLLAVFLLVPMEEPLKEIS